MVFTFTGISQVIALTFDKESPLRVSEGRTENIEIAKAFKTGRGNFHINNPSVPFRIDPSKKIFYVFLTY